MLNPATGGSTGSFSHATTAEIEQAIHAVQRAQKHWWQQSALDRAAALHTVAAQLVAISAFRGRLPLRRRAGPPRPGAHCGPGHRRAVAQDDQGAVGNGGRHRAVQLSRAVVLLAAGNAIIVKPSELTPLTLLLLMEAFRHLPAGLVQVLNGGPEVGQTLVAHPHTHAIAFTGSVQTALENPSSPTNSSGECLTSPP